MKYKNKDGIELQMVGDDSTKTLIREVVSEAIRILNSHNHFDSQSKSWAIDRCINFLETNFDIEDERIEQGWSGEL
tara:strand:+ start:370 stop:597 length:228 start_codon:yes stop_codon:yes gene_type:complete